MFKHIKNSKRYDGMNRISKEYTITNNKEKVKAEYTYGATGGVTLVTNDTSAIANKYDNKGLLMEQKLFEDGKSYAMVYGNDGNGRCVYSKIYNNNTGHYGDYDIQQMISYEYDAKGNMTTVSDSLNNSKVMARYAYDSNDNLSSVTYGNGTSTSYMYNKGNMIEKVTNNNADNTQMSYYSYEYYLDGNVSKQNRNGVNCYYDYDEFSRITDEDYGNEEIDYYYDAAGNRTMKKICDDNGDTDVNYTYDLNNRLLEESNHSYANNETDVTKYVYDNNGNQIKKIGYTTKGVNGSPSQDLVSENELNNTYEIYKYNEFNEMTSFESNKEAVWYYAYLPNGLRYRKHKNNYNNSDWFVWDRNGNIIAEMNNNKEYTNKYVRGNKLISKNDNEYYSYDGHGSVVNISNEDGKSIKNYDYDAFGVELNKDANDTNLFRYCGEQYDNETDSIYLRARYYSPSLGRFTTEDPVKDGDNWYSYCAGNPVNGWDPSGLDKEKHLNVPAFSQKYSQDCWGAALSGYFAYKLGDTTDRQDDIVESVYKNLTKNFDIDDDIVKAQEIENVNEAIGCKYYEVDKYNSGAAPKYYTSIGNIPVMEFKNVKDNQLREYIISEIDKENPLIILYNDSGLGHYITVTGYTIKGNEMTVNYNDSLGNGESVKKTASIDTIKSHYTYDDGKTCAFKAVYGVSTGEKKEE